MLAAPRFNRLDLVRTSMGLIERRSVSTLLLAGLFALPTVALGAEPKPMAVPASGTQTNDDQTPEDTPSQSQTPDEPNPHGQVGSETPVGAAADASARAASGAAQDSSPLLRIPARSSRRNAAWLSKVPGEKVSQPATEPAAMPRTRGAWVSVARSATQADDAVGNCPRCGQALSPAGATATGAAEVPVVSSLGELLRGLLGLGLDVPPVTQPLTPGEPAAVLWEVRQSLGSDPLEGTIFNDPGFNPAAVGMVGSQEDDGDVTFVQWIRSRQSANVAPAKAARPAHSRPTAAQGNALLASGSESGPADTLDGAPPGQDGISDASTSAPVDFVDGPTTADAADDDPEEVRGIETLPPPHSDEDLVECLRESSRQLEVIAHDLERHRFYDPADDLRYMAARLRREARRHQRPEQFAPEGTPAEPIDGEPTTTAQARIRTELLELRREVARLRELLLRSVDERMGKRR